MTTIAELEKERSRLKNLRRYGHAETKARFPEGIKQIDQYFDELANEIRTKQAASQEKVQALNESKKQEQLQALTREKPPGQVAELRSWQQAPADQLVSLAINKTCDAAMLISKVRTGKSYMVGNAIAQLKHAGYFNDCIGFYKCLVVTAANVVTQFENDLKNQFGLDTIVDVKVINYEQLRATFGKDVLTQEWKVKGGEEYLEYSWKPFINPKLIIWDECQKLKNVDTLQSKIAQACSKLAKGKMFQIYMSATPGTRISDFKSFCLNIRAPIKSGVTLSEENWSEFAGSIATDGDPFKHSPAAMDRLQDELRDYVIRVIAPHGKYKNTTLCKTIPFDNDTDKKVYDASWETYVAECSKLNKNPAEGRFALLVAFNRHRKTAEYLRRKIIAREMKAAVESGFTAIGAVCFRSTIAGVVRSLIHDHGVLRDDICLIWGGDDTQVATNRLSQAEMISYLKQMASGQKIPGSIRKQLEKQLIEEADDKAELSRDLQTDQDLRLGNQSRPDRLKEMNRLQSGKAKYCLFTYASGGVGINIFHSGKNNKGLPAPEQRPRRAFLTPIFSAQDFVQGLGRAHADVFSISDTIQTILYFADTVEVDVMNMTRNKLKCLSKVIKSRESWSNLMEDAALDGERAKKRVAEAEADAVKYADTEDVDLNTEEEEEDEDN